MDKLTLFDLATFRKFVKPGEVVEVRIPKVSGKHPAWGNEWARGTVSGYFDDHGAFCKAVEMAEKTKHGGIYFTLQIIDPRLIGRAFNRLRATDLTTSDNNVRAYRWLPIDIDPKRPAGVSSSDSELSKALDARDRIAEWIEAEYQFGNPLRAMSGNGGHLLYEFEEPLPATDESKALVHGILEALAEEFNTDDYSVDRTVFNPARIWKLYGTTARKGDEIPEGPYREARPWRMAYIEGGGHD